MVGGWVASVCCLLPAHPHPPLLIHPMGMCNVLTVVLVVVLELVLEDLDLLHHVGDGQATVHAPVHEVGG